MNNKRHTIKSSTDFIIRRMAIIDAYRHLVETLVLLGDALQEDAVATLPCWVQKNDFDSNRSHTDRAVRILQLLTYGNNDYSDGRRAETRFGFVAASANTLQKVADVNAVKITLKNAIKDLKEFSQNNKMPVERELSEITGAALNDISRAPIIREALAAAKIPRLHIKQSTRKIVVLEEQPLRMGFTISHGSHVVRELSRDEAIRLAEKWHNDEAIEQLAPLSPSTAIAQYQSLAKHIRCNIVYADRTHRQGRPNQVNAYLPIFYPHDATRAPVKHNALRTESVIELEDAQDRLPRMSTKVDHRHPFSASLGLYPYLANDENN